MGNEDDRRRKTPCGCCMNVFKWTPVLFIFAVIGWSYYAYVVELCVLKTENRIAMVFMLLFYHITLVLFLWSYWKTITTKVGRVPDQWRIPDDEVNNLFRAENPETQKRILNNFARNLPVTNRTINGSVRFCEKCKIIKPDRSHHCSLCSCCVLKMDHHCPWVNNCVNFSNYKFFVLFLGYALIYCLYVALTSLHDCILFVKGQTTGSGMGRFHIIFLFFISIMFAISLVSLFGYHIYLVLVNRTTLEAFRAPIFRIGGPDKNGYNLGRYANFCEVFGDEWKLWFLPVFSSKGDGLSYRTSSEQTGNGQRYEAMGNTAANGAGNRLDVQPTDKLIDAIPLNNHQPHLELDNGQSSSNNHPLISSSQAVVNIDQTEPGTEAAPTPPAAATKAATNNAGVVIDMIGDQLTTATAPTAKDTNGGLSLMGAEKIV